MKLKYRIKAKGVTYYIFSGGKWNMQVKSKYRIKLSFDPKRIRTCNVFVYDDYFEPTQYLLAEPNGDFIIYVRSRIWELRRSINGIFNSSNFNSNTVDRLRIDLWVEDVPDEK